MVFVMTTRESSHIAPGGRHLPALSLAALGVVYGDIGTSPLYALRECFYGTHAVAATPANILGVLSLIFWSLIFVISIKYLVFILRADNQGEGGVLALTALITPVRSFAQGSRWLIMLGLFGAALLYGDGMITPAISVLSAVEGIEIATPLLKPYVIPITIVILIALFQIQRRGTAGVGAVFGSITLVWFLVLSILGISQIIQEPGVLSAVNPLHCVSFFLQNKLNGFLVLGAVFLVMTGGEALYADMGHFGTRPIRVTWFLVVLPSLLINYFGQGALLMGNPSAAVNPLYQMAPRWALYPMVILATMAAVIASQAVISGTFSLTMQAIQLGYSPRMDIEHTSARKIGQIYLPAINWGLMIACIGLVAGFRTSSNLAAAYGVAVTTTMVITSMLFYFVLRNRWGWSLPAALLLCACFLVFDLSFFGANILKIAHGGWFPILIAALIFILMSTWKTGRRILAQRLQQESFPLKTFLSSISLNPPARVPGTAVFMYSNPSGTPSALLHNLKHNKVMHERVVILNVVTEGLPYVAEEDRMDLEELGHGLYRMVIHYGFMENPDIPKVLGGVKTEDLEFKPLETTFFLGRETLIASKKPGLALWRRKLFIWMSHNARGATYFFGLPANRVVELGTHIEL